MVGLDNDLQVDHGGVILPDPGGVVDGRALMRRLGYVWRSRGGVRCNVALALGLAQKDISIAVVEEVEAKKPRSRSGLGDILDGTIMSGCGSHLSLPQVSRRYVMWWLWRPGIAYLLQRGYRKLSVISHLVD